LREKKKKILRNVITANMSEEEFKSTDTMFKRSPEQSFAIESVQTDHKPHWPTSILDFNFTEQELKFIKELIPESEYDPPLFIFWDTENLESFRNKISLYNGPLESPFPIPSVPNINNLSVAIVDSWRAGIAGIPASIRGMCVPGTLRQYSLLYGNAMEQCHDPWWTHVDATRSSFPLARLYVLRPNDGVLLDPLTSFP
jgi:hypothetical protein